jgi:hypothetical protein
MNVHAISNKKIYLEIEKEINFDENLKGVKSDTYFLFFELATLPPPHFVLLYESPLLPPPPR